MDIQSMGETSQTAFDRTIPEERMLQSMNDELDELLGPGLAKAFNYRVDPRVALRDPRGYQDDLKAMFGPPSVRIIQRLRDGLCRAAGKSPKAACKGIEGCLKCFEQNEWGTSVIPKVPARTPFLWDAMVQFRYPLA
jgi:hypothetical protein